MLTRLLDRAASPVSSPARIASVGLPRPKPDLGYDAILRFARLAADLATAIPVPTHARYSQPPVFFFDRRRQAELETARPAVPAADPHAELAAHIGVELPALFASVEVRRVARATPGLRPAAEALAPVWASAKELADLLAVPDDEVVTVLHPGLQLGFRLLVGGVADIGQFHILLAAALDDLLPGPPWPWRFMTACRDVNPTLPAGVPMIAEARFQMYTPLALRPDGLLPCGFGGSKYWLRPHMPLAGVPRCAGERVLLLGPCAYRATWDVTRRFPALPAAVRLLEVLSAERARECLAKRSGNAMMQTDT